MQRTTYPAVTAAGRERYPGATQPRGSRIARSPDGLGARRPRPELAMAPPVKAMEPIGITVLPDAGRDEQLERWGISPERVGERERERGHHWHDYLDGVGTEPDEDDELGLSSLGFLADGGWRVVDPRWSKSRLMADGGGMSAHRGVLHPDEYVDAGALRAAVEAELGFTYDDVHGVYRRGRLSASTLELRARIDARFLELASTGANIAALGRVLGFSVDNSGSCSALNGALARARKGRSL